MPFKPLPTAIAVLITLLIWFVIPVPAGVDSNAWQLLALFVGTIAAIIGKALPIGAISIIAVTLVALTGVTADNPKDAINDALSSFANPLIWLIGVAVMISRGLIKTGLGARIAYNVVAIFGKKTLGIGYSLAIAELILAPVTPSNTARGGAIVHPIMRSIADGFHSKVEDGTEGRMGKFLALVNYHSNPITSAMFITATAPNPLVVKLVGEVTGREIHLSWATWALAMFLPGMACLLLMPLVIYALAKPSVTHTPDVKAVTQAELSKLGKITRPEQIMLATFALMLLLWAGVPAMLLGDGFAVNATAVAFLGLSLLILTGVLTWEDILKEKSAWDTIIWFGVLVMMATYLNKLGLVGWFSSSIEALIAGLGIGWVGAVAILTLVYLYAHYFFASTTAHITAMFAAFYTVGLSLGAPPMLYALILAATSSLMMTLTHYATGTAPVIFGSGYTTLGEWWKVGFVMSVVNLLVWLGVGLVWWKLLGHY